MKRLALALLACRAPATAVTALRLTVTFDASAHVDQLEVHAGAGAWTVPSSPEPLASGRRVVLLLDDDQAGSSLDVAVWGLASGTRVAYGTATATPQRRATVDAAVALALLPCGDWCASGAVGCSGDGVTTCGTRSEDGCTAWGAAAVCAPGSDTPFCSHGVCAAACVDECAAGETRCAGPARVERCGQSDSDTCADWGAPEACPDGQTCDSGRCHTGPCADECTAGQTVCAGDGVATCGQFDADDCLDLGPPAPCPSGQSCTGGACSPSCHDECTASACDGLTWRACGQFDSDTCRDARPGQTCPRPADACMVATCDDAAGCGSGPMACDMPPPATCVNADTQRRYSTPGACGGGMCSYSFEDVLCPSCPNCLTCAAPCDSPPSPSACYAAGECVGGSCQYPYADGATCDDGDSCTTDDRCARGMCHGTLCAAPPSPSACYVDTGTCEETDGSCVYAYADGAMCDDGDPTTTGDTCASGVCAGTRADDMVDVPAGAFGMGCVGATTCGSAPAPCNYDEAPYHTVTLSHYAIDRTEVTVAAYTACVLAGACTAPDTSAGCNWGISGRDTHPVNCIDWSQASGYCAWAGKRLPTEAEWEKAARGTDSRVYPWGSATPTCALANYSGCSGSTDPVDSHSSGASPYGALNMAGNVFEWVSDWYDDSYYCTSPSTDPVGPSSARSFRGLLGGAWGEGADRLRTSCRGHVTPLFRGSGVGFRCARSVSP